MSRISFLLEFCSFLKSRQKYWLLPIFIMLMLLGTLIVFTESSSLSPFIYILF